MTDNDFQRIQELLTTNFDAMEERNNKRFEELDEKIYRNHKEVTARIDTLSKDIETQRQDSLQAQGALKLLTGQYDELTGRVAIIESKLQAA